MPEQILGCITCTDSTIIQISPKKDILAWILFNFVFNLIYTGSGWFITGFLRRKCILRSSFVDECSVHGLDYTITLKPIYLRRQTPRMFCENSIPQKGYVALKGLLIVDNFLFCLFVIYKNRLISYMCIS